MESFLALDKDDRVKHFFALVNRGDFLFATVLAKNSSGFLLHVNNYENLKLTLEDLNIKAFCPAAEAVFTANNTG